MIPEVFTASDAIAALSDFMSGMERGNANHPEMFRALQQAYREVGSYRDWSFLRTNGRVFLRAPYTTGTITYDLASRGLTLAGGTWPSWTEDGSVRISDVVHDVASVSGQVATLDAVMSPVADIAAGTSYSLFPRWYALPNDLKSMFDVEDEDRTFTSGRYVSPEVMARLIRSGTETGDVVAWTVRAVPDLIGTMGLFVYPASDEAQTLDFLYNRHPRPLRYSGFGDADFLGTIAVVANSTAVTGTSTSFDSRMVGSILRIGSNSTHEVSGLEGGTGANPYAEQRSITAVASAASLTLDAVVITTRSGVNYRISDPIDLKADVHLALMRSAEYHLATAKNTKDRTLAFRISEDAKRKASMADGRTRANRIAGGGGGYSRTRLTYIDTGVR